MTERLDAILAALESDRGDPRLTFHEPLYSTADAQRVAGVPDGVDTKSTVWVDAAGVVVVATVSGDARVALPAVRSVLGLARMRMADEELVAHRLGIVRGAVAPFGYDAGVRCVIDSDLMRCERVLISPGANDATLALQRDAWNALVERFGCCVAPIRRALPSA